MLPHAELASYRGLFSMRTGDAALVSVPSADEARWREQLSGIGAEDLISRLAAWPSRTLSPHA